MPSSVCAELGFYNPEWPQSSHNYSNEHTRQEAWQLPDRSQGTVEGTMVGMQGCLGCLLLIFLTCKQLQLLQVIVIRLCTTSNRRGLVVKDLVVKSVYKKCPFPAPPIISA